MSGSGRKNRMDVREKRIENEEGGEKGDKKENN